MENALNEDDDSALRRLERIESKAGEIQRFDRELAALVAPLESARASIEEVLFQVQRYVSAFDLDPETLVQMEERLGLLRHLQKKYGGSSTEILETLERFKSEIEELENFERRKLELEKKIAQTELTLRGLAAGLAKVRRAHATTLTKLVNAELEDLHMKGVKFSVAVSDLQKPAPTGMNEVEFFIQNEKGDQPRALARFASGGELSRILLSLKKVVGRGQFPRTYLFDEVDSGVSGVTAEKVGKKLHVIARNQQVICVTHLPQVAIHGDAHFMIEKKTGTEQVEMQVFQLDGEARVREIARLLSGEEVSETSLQHARHLLDRTVEKSAEKSAEKESKAPAALRAATETKSKKKQPAGQKRPPARETARSR